MSGKPVRDLGLSSLYHDIGNAASPRASSPPGGHLRRHHIDDGLQECHPFFEGIQIMQEEITAKLSRPCCGFAEFLGLPRPLGRPEGDQANPRRAFRCRCSKGGDRPRPSAKT
jgi:hypothetical protein